NYTITRDPVTHKVTVADNASVAEGGLFAKGDGIDTLWNIEQLRFCTGNDPVTKKCNAFETFSVADAIAAAVAAGQPDPVPAAPVIRVSPATITFAGQLIGTNSAPTVITVSNIGNAPLTVSSIAVDPVTGGPSFSAVNGCTADVAPGALCTISVTFSPTTVG